MHSDATLESDIVTSHRHPPELELVYALAVLWSLDEPERVGEIALIPQESLAVLGRGDREGEVAGGRLRLCRQRPGRN